MTMFQNYLATKEDFEAIEEGIATVWRKELDFIFQDRKLLQKVIVISFDAKRLYLWSKINLPKLNISKCFWFQGLIPEISY